MKKSHSPTTVIEVSWEVVNKVGGINTVVKSKADLLVDHYDNYLMIGPSFPNKQDPTFAEEPAPESIKQAFNHLLGSGIQCVYGRWLIKGKPATVLIDASQSTINVDEVKKLLWDKFGIDSLDAAHDFNEPLKWAWAVGMFVEQYQKVLGERVVLQCHEWMAGFALLYSRFQGNNVGSVFTTHATMLGRSICASSDIDLYANLKDIDSYSVARQLRVMDKFTTEVACAKEADVFTTVSEITGLEAEHLLGRKPDVLLFNGIDESKFPTIEEASLLHIRARERIRDFLDYYFFSHYYFDLEQSLTFFISGRYEYRNKGFDVLTKALGRLNQYMKDNDHRKTIVVFYYVPGEAHGIKTELLEERAAFSHMQQYLQDHGRDIVRKILRNAGQLEKLSCTDLMSEEMRSQVEQMSRSMLHEGTPPLCTHNLPNEDQDAIIQSFKAHGLLNRQEDKVKVVRYPIYLTGSDGLLDLTYTEAVVGSHLGIFPSYYEPWGYTPVEAAALGIPAVTTDLAGFGRFILEKSPDINGIYVLPRLHRSEEEIVSSLYDYLVWFSNLDKYNRMDEKLEARELSQLTQWSTFIKEYFHAHTLAYEKK